MELIDLVALSSLPVSRRFVVQAAGLADAADGRLDTALSVVEPSANAAALTRAATDAVARGRAAGLTPLTWDNPDFPATLRQLPDPPLVLWVRGNPAVVSMPSAVAIVGSRAASPGALDISRDLAAGLAQSDLTIVSGLARGCDGAAHQGALDVDGITIAVLGSGADVIYPPEHAELARRIEVRGAVISELAPGTPPLPHFFPWRNRLIAGLSVAVVVVEAGERSGSLITAGCALEQGKDVMVVPGPVRSGRNRGAHLLIRDGAALVERAEDVLAELHLAGDLGPWPRSATRAGPSNEEDPRAPVDPVLDALDLDDAQDLDQLSARSGMPVADLLSRLSALELSGRVVRRPGGRFIRLRGPARGAPDGK